MNITIPESALVVLVGASGSGKSTFARRHFKPTEVISSDYCRGLVCDDETSLDATADAFDVLHYVAGKRLARNRLTVVDATNVQREARASLLKLAQQHHVLPVAIVLDMPERLCHDRNRGRPDRAFGPHVVRRHRQDLRRSLGGLRKEGFTRVYVLTTPEEVEAATIVRERLWVDRRDTHGPFDLIGDVHGCYDELVRLLHELGYAVTDAGAGRGPVASHPDGRTAVFLGDLVDRGPATPAVLRLVMNMVRSGAALCVAGNHENKLLRKLKGRDVQISHGLAETLAQLEGEPAEFVDDVRAFLDELRSHYVLDDGKLVAAHAGLPEAMHGRASPRVRDFALYGDTTGESDEYGLPVRLNWAAEYRGRATVVYGHTPVAEPEWLNNTLNVDTGCVFGGRLTALRYPERQLVSVPAARTYYEPVRPLQAPVEPTPAPALSAQQRHDDVLDVADVLGKRVIDTRLHGPVGIREENAAAALEVMARFAVDPKWLIYLPPTMSPSETSARPGLLEHPDEAFAYFRRQGVAAVVCEEKHMGSRVVAVVCRDADAARDRFGVTDGRAGILYTRTGRQFFDDDALQAALVDRVRAALDATGLWDRLGTTWVCLDAELMPWSAKAQGLVQHQYAAVGAASRAALAESLAAVGAALRRPDAPVSDMGPLLERLERRASLAERYVAAYRRYCWPVTSLDDLRLAPFQLLASEGAVHLDRDHKWHVETLAELAEADRTAAGDGCPAVLQPTPHRLVDLGDDASVEAATGWWEELTGRGGEGMVVKPLDVVVRGQRGLVQPALKCRGPEYLRIIYGPEYSESENLERLRKRGVGAKRSLAAREFALGIEALERFVRREPLRRVHECVFGVLALESEPVDPRL